MNRLLLAIVFVVGFTQVLAAGDHLDPRRSRAPRRDTSVQAASHTRSVRANELPSPSRRSQVRQASHSSQMHGEVMHGDVIHDGVVYGDEMVYDSGCDSCGGGCDGSCGSDVGYCDTGSCFQMDICNSCFEPSRLCICLPNHGWVHAEYLNWWQRGMNLPPLLAQSRAGTLAGDTGVLGLNTTSVIVGGNDVLTDSQSGGRIRFGWWFANSPTLGIEGEYFGLGTMEQTFLNQSAGQELLGRPFFNTTIGENDSELVSFDGIVGGSFRTDVRSSVDGAAVRFRKSLCCGSGCSYSWLACGAVPTQSRIDATLGWRYMQLGESLVMQESIDSQLTSEPGSFEISDQFHTRNQFNGVEMGVIWQGRRGYWTLDGIMRVSVGNILQKVAIAGSTIITQPGQTTETYETGFLAQRSNIGEYSREVFGVLPEWNATLGYQLTPRLRATLGYNFMFLSNVIRPGDQIDLDINENLLAPEQPLGDQAARPVFDFVETDYWLQGINIGAEYRW